MVDHGTFYWNELMTRDAERAKAFYAATLGWTFDAMEMPDGTYWIIKAGDTMAGGIFPMSGPDFEGVPENWFAYIAVDDIDARVTGVAPAGGQVMRPPSDIPGIGRFAVVRDATGAMIGWITPAPMGG